VGAFAGRARVLHALRSRDFRLVWGGQSVSLIGNGALFVALGWRAVALTGKSTSLAFVLLLWSLGMLTTLLIGGALADRYERRRLMIISDVSRGLLVAGLAVVDASGHLTLTRLLLFALALGLGDGFFHPAFGGIVPLVVEQPLLASANALIGISRNISFVIGPAIASALYAGVGPSSVFAFDAWTYAFSAALLWLARPRSVEREGEPTGTLREVADGIRYVAGVPWLWVTISLAALIVMVAFAPYQALLPKLVQEHFHLGVGAYGTLFSLQAVGMVVGALLFGQINPRRHRVVLFYSFFALNDLCVIGMALVPSYQAAIALVTMRGGLIGFSNALWETVMIELVPEDKLSRVVSLDYFGSFGLTPVGFALTALLAGFFTASDILVVSFSFAAFLWIAPLASKRLRSAA
jgi:MFS family permease